MSRSRQITSSLRLWCSQGPISNFSHLNSASLASALSLGETRDPLQANPLLQQITGEPANPFLQQFRHYSLRIDFNPVETASRVYDVETISQFFPNRKDLLPHFTALGVTLIPANLPPASPIEPLQADSVKRKRKTKMKRHKHRKRLKMLRHKNAP